MQTQLAQEDTSPEEQRNKILQYLKGLESYSAGCVSKYGELGNSLNELYGGLGEVIDFASKSEDFKKEIGDFKETHSKYISDSKTSYENIDSCKKLNSDVKEAISFYSKNVASRKEAKELEDKLKELFKNIEKNREIVIENSRKLGYLLIPGNKFPDIYGKIVVQMGREKAQEITSKLNRSLKIVMKNYFIPTKEEIQQQMPKES